MKSRHASAKTEKMTDEMKLSSKDSHMMAIRKTKATGLELRPSRKQTQVAIARARQPKTQSAIRYRPQAPGPCITWDSTVPAYRRNRLMMCPTHRPRDDISSDGYRRGILERRETPVHLPRRRLGRHRWRRNGYRSAATAHARPAGRPFRAGEALLRRTVVQPSIA